MNHPVLVIWFKELLDTLRDRRTLVAMIIAPMLLTPLLVVLPLRLLEEQRRAQENAVVKVAVAGAEHAPALIESLRASRKVEVIEASNPEEAIRARRAWMGTISSTSRRPCAPPSASCRRTGGYMAASRRASTCATSGSCIGRTVRRSTGALKN